LWVNKSMPKQSSDPYIAEALSWLEQVTQKPHGAKRASLYTQLAAHYRAWHMYGRSIEMYRKSLEAHDDWEDSWKVRGDLAELFIRIYGEDGFEDARVQACDYVPLQWPVKLEIERKQAAIERHTQKTALDRDYPALKTIVGESQNVLEVYQKIITYAASSAPVLITGDSGTGKEVVARALAEISGRQFIPFNCGAVAEGVLESDLFDHVKGAFTDARTDKQGLFETPGAAVIFLDEIGDASQKFQAALLRVIDNREVQRVGDPHIRMLTGSKKVVCATAKDLETEVYAGRFRNDLFRGHDLL
jgi:transcriptional regulator of acetoin/glycerol metabolism